MNVLLDERSRPPLRSVIGALLGSAEEADMAVTNVRIAALDMHADELARVRRCRFLLGKLDAHALDPGALIGGDPRPRMAALLHFLRSGAVEVRSAGMSSWSPDFSIYRGITGGGNVAAVCLVGAHYFQEPREQGPSFTWAVDDPAHVHRATRRFEEMWQEGHDVLGAVVQTIERFALSAA
jgi:hypothetical protein